MTSKQPTPPRLGRAQIKLARAKTKPCRECSEPIHLDAMKCKTCGEYQDKRRFLAFSSTFVALLVALVSVISLSIPMVTQALDSRDSNINVLYQGAQNDKAYFLVTNSGTRDGSISYARLIVSTPVENFGQDDRVALRFDLPPLTIPAGKSQQIVLNLDGDARALIDRSVYEMWLNNGADKPKELPTLQFRLGHISFKEGLKSETTFSPAIYDLLSAGPTKWHRCAGSIPYSEWNGPTSNFFPEDITPEGAELFCGKLPPTFNNKARDPIKSPRPNAIWP